MNQYLKLLMAREGREVLGRKGSNLWILTIVLTATFLSIAFSEGSRVYLRFKMVDPFTNWVSIKNSTDGEQFSRFKKVLEEVQNKDTYGYSSVQMDQTTNWIMDGVNDGNHEHYLSLRSFENLESNIVKAILNKDNVVGNACIDSSFLNNNTLGVIISLDAATQLLGYSEDFLPSYICHMAYTEGADTLGIQVSESGYVRIPLPVLAVVKRLPENVDMVIGRFLYSQRENNATTLPFNFAENEEYLHQLRFFVADEIGIEKFSEVLTTIAPDSLKENIQVFDDLETENMRPWRKGVMCIVSFGNKLLPRDDYQYIANKLEDKFNPELVTRVHAYNVASCSYSKGTFISVEFKDQSHIREFERFAKDYAVQLEMSKVASMENFNAVTVIARVLSAAMVIFSIVCIIMFMVNMLQNYFQKVKRNLGTFKAFGMNSSELVKVYVIILVTIVSTGVILALLFTWGVQWLLPVIGVEKEGFNYLSLWNTTTYIATAVIFVATIMTVIVVMTRMLSQTPGDLIYDRN